MNRAELVKAILANKKAEIESKAAAERILKAVLDAIATGMKKQGVVSLVGFGTFKVKSRPARMGRNPQTGKAIKISARKVASFKASAELKKSL
jgi:DNA-binding protein HU-beta